MNEDKPILSIVRDRIVRHLILWAFLH